jgi:hypothetical protein
MSLLAPSHFSYEISYKDFLISDLQGFGLLFIDPAVHTINVEPFYIIE